VAQTLWLAATVTSGVQVAHCLDLTQNSEDYQFPPLPQLPLVKPYKLETQAKSQVLQVIATAKSGLL
jgi:hypothetical protein